MISLLSYLCNGISLGSVYAIIALGYTMVYGIAKMLNFAHGDVIMIGAYVTFCCIELRGTSSPCSGTGRYRRLHPAGRYYRAASL